jgi:hypothetical protein
MNETKTQQSTEEVERYPRIADHPVSKLETEESYPIYLHNIGGKDRD